MNELKHLAEFETLLAGYKPSAESLEILKQTKIVILVGPSGGGRNTLIEELIKTGRYYFIVSDTTRKPRINNGKLEENGLHYWFRSEEEVLEDIKSGNFLEAEVLHGQQVSGMSIRELEKAKSSNKIAINDIDIGGVDNILEMKPDAMAILLVPPSYEIWQRRMLSRGPMAAAEYARRMKTASKIFQAGINDKRLRIIVNENVHLSVKQVERLVAEGVLEQDQDAARELLKELLLKTELRLNSAA